MGKPKSKSANAWVRDLEDYMANHPPSERGAWFADLPNSVKKAHEYYSSKAKHRFPGIEVGALIVILYGKANGIVAPSEDHLIQISQIVTVWLGIRSAAELVQMDIHPPTPTPGDKIEDYLSRWLAEEKAS